MVKKPSDASKNPMRIPAGLYSLAVPIDSLRPDPDNANMHDPDSIVAIKASLEKFGQLKAIVATADGVIRAGNGTWLAAKELGASKIAVVVIPKDLEAHAEEFALADNQAGRLSRWDPVKLKAAIDRLKAAGGSPQGIGFNEKDLQALLAKIKPPKPESNWDGATPSKARSKTGDLWALGDHRLLVADCRDVRAIRRMMGGRKAQMVFTDPPYGVDYEDAKGRKIKNDALGRDTLSTFLTAAFKAAVEVTASDAAFYIWHASTTRADFDHALKAAGLEERQYLIWAKPALVLGRADYQWNHEPCFYAGKAGAKPALVLGRADYQWNHEPCFYAGKAGAKPAFYAGRAETTLWRIAVREAEETAAALGPGLMVSDGNGAELQLSKPVANKKLRHLRVEPGSPLFVGDAKGQGTVWEVSRDTMQTVHPNQKPVELAVRAIENSSQPGQAVLDLFGGSGSTLMAAEQTGRAAFLSEMDPKYADAILNRWEKTTKNKAERL